MHFETLVVNDRLLGALEQITAQGASIWGYKEPVLLSASYMGPTEPIFAF